MKSIRLIIIALCVLTLTACASSRSAEIYTRDQARQAYVVQTGVVTDIRAVRIEGTKSPIGALGGAAIGSIAGGSVGGGRGSQVAAILGGIGGWILGATAEEAVTQRDGFELTVRLDSGRMIAVVQEADVAFRLGDRVRVLSQGGETRVRY
ncbi:hypothetical protein [Thioflexithrix psekupsensis]|uniref:Glycine zipper 2TM domain-containing protein n=1 Tax=Thioflexithrix psekupsensis TaxID=1570016 RepID=A0A251XB48_9GAMM|nr:hypothetical protein [Thioflexithrix psekupsensis]OUD15589.1 hypothetical protein TPSD3_03460 [Thioflexithrix psekupsensis]